MARLLYARPLQTALVPQLLLRAPACALLPRVPAAAPSLSLPRFRLFQAPSRRCSRMAGSTSATDVAEQTIYDFVVKDIDKKDVSLSTFKGKVLLIINVASGCGLTNSNYNGLAELYSKLKDQGFEILAFPCNQFGGQEPGTNQEIKEFACSRFKAEYPIFDKVDVNGEKTAPLYKFLKSSKSTGLLGSLLGDNIKWNFEKFLVDKRGHIVQRYEPITSPSKIEKDIENLLKA
ncbi:hypothetical protein L7F22_012545 [Adiantum nelumboides]|nr:hypothetical protein [Adiantum nelumboides]